LYAHVSTLLVASYVAIPLALQDPLPSFSPSSPFPYTTLFRSGRAGGTAHAGRTPCAGGPSRARPGARATRARAGASRRAGGAAGDRKSTRLNSSHVSISYAVFCLKKKKQVFTIITITVVTLVI